MELKHKTVFIPQAIRSLGLEAIADEYRRVAERVNLYSISRGSNRFEAIVLCLRELRESPTLREVVPDPEPVAHFVASGLPLANESFSSYVGDNPNPLLLAVLDWSATSNRMIAELDTVVPPFEGVREALTLAREFADTMVVSATPAPALRKEWGKTGLLPLIDAIAGQEVGPKREQLRSANAAGFDRERVLMVGDAPGDHRAAVENEMLFFPITPGAEEASWAELRENGLDRFREGRFVGPYEERIISNYYRALEAAESGTR